MHVRVGLELNCVVTIRSFFHYFSSLRQVSSAAPEMSHLEKGKNVELTQSLAPSRS